MSLPLSWQYEWNNFCFQAKFHFTFLTKKKKKYFQGKTFSSGFDKKLLTAQLLRTTIFPLSETVGGPLVGRTSTPTPQGFGVAGRRKADLNKSHQ